MKTIKPAPHHRMVRRPLIDSVVKDVDVSGTARPIVSAPTAGVAPTTVAAGVVNAAPVTPQSEPQSVGLNTMTVAVDDVATVEVPDIEWTAEENITASATVGAPASTPAAATPVVDQPDLVASHSETRSDATSNAPVRQATLNAAGGDIVPVALGLTSIPYVYGGEVPGGLDCSGLVKYAYAAIDINLPHSPSTQATGGTIVSDPQPGDIVSYPGHVAIYTDGGQMVEAAVPGRLSQVSPVRPGATYVCY